MNFEQAVEFHKSAGKYGSILGLYSIRSLMAELGDVWKMLKIVHIAGTNGKGSVCCFLASVLKEAGYRTGQFNSPAVFDIRETCQINGIWIKEEEYASCMEAVQEACGRMQKKGFSHPTVFEIETALAFLWFYRRNCDIVLLETGMGGGTDATNLIEKPLCSVFTSIRMDHMDFLGGTLGEIAEVKAGIIKDSCPVITADQLPEAETVLKRRAEKCSAPLYKAVPMERQWMENGKLCCLHPEFGKLELSMTGSYQAENAALAIQTLAVLQEQGYPVAEQKIRNGIRMAVWPGRFECILESPLFYIDGAHNTDAAEKLKQSLVQTVPDQKRIGIMGVMADKPYREMTAVLKPLFEHIYTVTPDNKRALPAEKLAEEIRRQGGRASAADSVRSAVGQAYEEAMEEGQGRMITAFGSLYFLREVKRALHEITGD